MVSTISWESLGKKSKGIIPIISSMPKDNHSLLQLYLDGPKNNFLLFIMLETRSLIKYLLNFCLTVTNF